MVEVQIAETIGCCYVELFKTILEYSTRA